ncbi:alpha/beta hydrolase fold protein [Arcobacter nitrofigilis DSM 7299]|uniref:Alpha/beta hydrolase fold protein n=1 Tax=Arcobacter nitrofigilis (strain ATCC 33309 / DSM 7299 / CCUG 15893 / LMG 7604 / NCTC 12251 / CI) TaxID=572480 RepID=D5V6H0_ARCNC|nr:alpha/beta hydrolase [Arcobacter nitrofigilis]ADG94240.1 alpha/beta hydrolase fold protein [Arcobacter nitrofigilis DSM 7299]
MTILGHNIIGSGKKYILVLHELMGDHSNFDPILPYIDTTNFTYIFIDHRGYGLSKDILGEYTCDEAANDIKNLITKLNLKEVNLLAHSMSTMIAQKVALIDDRVKQLILITPISAAGIKMKSQAQAKLIDSMKKNENFIEYVVESASNRYNQAWKDYRIKMGYEASTLEARTGYMIMYLTTDFIDEVKDIKIPIKIMVGHHDLPAFHKNNVKKQFEKYYNDFEIIECMEAGHYPMIECPVYFASEIEKFCSNLFLI